VRLASARLPQKIQNLIFLSGDFHVHQSLQGPFLFVFVHLCRRPPLRRVIPSAARDLLFAVVVAGLQTRQRDGRERTCVIPKRSEGPAFRRRSGGLQTGQRDGRERTCVIPKRSEGSAFRRRSGGLQTGQRDGRERPVCSLGRGTRLSPLQSKPCPSPSTNTSTPTAPIPGAKPSAPPTNSPPITRRPIPNPRPLSRHQPLIPQRHQTHLPPPNRSNSIRH
jgi:hypothetical protein